MYLIWLLISALCFAAGEYLSKMFALEPRIEWAVGVLVAYNLGTLAWLPAIVENNQLSIVGAIWSVLSLAVTVCVGIFLFHEHLSLCGVVGLLCAALAVVLLSMN